MAIIGIPEQINEDGKQSNARTGSFSLLSTVPATAAVDDVILLHKLAANQVVEAYIRHSTNDATLVMDYTLIPAGCGGNVAFTAAGDPAIIDPPYFSLDVAFDTPRLADFNISRSNIATESLRISDALDSFVLSQSFFLCAVVKAAPTAAINILVKGRTRGY